VTSSTIPEATAKNVRLAGQRHPETGIVFDDRGFPIFDPVVKFDTRISKDIALSGNERKHMRTATKMLREEIQAQRVDPAKFSAEQLQDIMAGRDTIANYTWHHHQDVGRMQLIPRDIHNKTGHIGGNHIWSSQGGN
jgi:filamentous hemagglutinin